MMMPFQATIIPAYLITGKLGLLNSYLGLALPMFSTIICIFVFKASFDSVPRSLIDAARIDGLSAMQDHLAGDDAAREVGGGDQRRAVAFIWSWNNFLWPLIVDAHRPTCRPCRSGSRASCPTRRTRPARSMPSVVMVLAPGILVFLMAQKEFIRGLTSGATKG